MIYLIDDKKARQKDFGWTEERFVQYSNLITTLYTISDIVRIGDKLYDDNNIILYHESFLDFTGDSNRAVEQRKKLVKKAASNKFLSVAFFSGSQSSRSLIENTANLPVAILYQNLEVLIQQHDLGNSKLNYLLFGEHPEIEEELDKKLTEANKNIEREAANISGNNLFIRPNLRNIQNAINSAKEVSIFPDVSDEKLSRKVYEWLNQEEFDNIFIPLCFGHTLSDFNGLRLATHIRSTETPNQLKRIFLYGFVGIECILQNEYFNILKTKNVELVDYSKKALQIAASSNFSPLKTHELPKELKKLELQPPNNYLDHHSIANEWAIFQWAKMIGCEEIEELQKVFKNINSNIYFKYLKAIYPIHEEDKISPDELNIKFKGKPKILLIDDEAEKGWNEIVAFLLTDVNNLYSDYLGEEFKNLNSSEILERSLKKIKDDDIDVVLLDFRLNYDDHQIKNPENNTSVSLLRKIKEINPGIQVVNFSATNKIWNLQMLQKEGSDGFVFKGRPENNGDQKAIKKNIKGFLSLMKSSFDKLFMKDFYNLTFIVKENLSKCEYEDESEYEYFIKDLLLQIKLINESGKSIDPKVPITIDLVFLNIYNFIEKFKNFYLSEAHHRFLLGIEEVDLYRYKYTNDKVINEGEFIRKSSNDNPSWYQCILGLIIDYFKILSKEDQRLIKVWMVKEWRNNYIHNDKNFFTASELLDITKLMVLITSKMRE